MKKTKIFVYGTLRNHFSNHGLLEQSTWIGEAQTISKFLMHTIGGIPFVSKQQSISTIKGEVYEIDTKTLSRIDRLEGCRLLVDQPNEFSSDSWYVREMVTVELTQLEVMNKSMQMGWGEGDLVTVWMYFNEKETINTIVPTGNFKDAQQFMNQPKRNWYFAYGSNMNAGRMLERNVLFTQRIHGWMNGFSLAFNKAVSNNDVNAYANIMPDANGRVEGVLYEVKAAGLATLDRYEGVKTGHYERVTMPVQTEKFGEVNAVVYVACADKVKSGLVPSPEYAEHLYKGLDVLGYFGKQYLDLAIMRSGINDDASFLDECDIPNIGENSHPEKSIEHFAKRVLLNGKSVWMYLYESTWSTKIVFRCEAEDVKYFQSMGIQIDENRYYLTKYFRFVQRGIVELEATMFLIQD